MRPTDFLIFAATAGLLRAQDPTVPELTKNQLMGRVDPVRDPDFALAGPDARLRKPVVEAFRRMSAAAAADGVTLRILSSTRTFADQRGIWERKWRLSKETDPVRRALGIMTYSSMPGTSRHHWGTDLDLNSLSPRWFETAEGRRVYEWLTRRAPEFGFCQPYTAKGPGGRATGYREEKWHWSYRPLAAGFLAQYEAKIRPADLKGFSGSAHAAAVRSIEDYAGGVDPKCR